MFSIIDFKKRNIPGSPLTCLGFERHGEAASVRFKYSNLLQLQTRISIWFGIRAKKEGRLKELSRRRRVGFYSQNLAGDGFLKISKNSLLSIWEVLLAVLQFFSCSFLCCISPKRNHNQLSSNYFKEFWRGRGLARMHFQNRIFRNVEQFAQNRSIAMLLWFYMIFAKGWFSPPTSTPWHLAPDIQCLFVFSLPTCPTGHLTIDILY